MQSWFFLKAFRRHNVHFFRRDITFQANITGFPRTFFLRIATKRVIESAAPPNTTNLKASVFGNQIGKLLLFVTEGRRKLRSSSASMSSDTRERATFLSAYLDEMRPPLPQHRIGISEDDLEHEGLWGVYSDEHSDSSRIPDSVNSMLYRDSQAELLSSILKAMNIRFCTPFLSYI